MLFLFPLLEGEYACTRKEKRKQKEREKQSRERARQKRGKNHHLNKSHKEEKGSRRNEACFLYIVFSAPDGVYICPRREKGVKEKEKFMKRG